eukprot:2099211-Pyramimonas_sp.AAC.1
MKAHVLATKTFNRSLRPRTREIFRQPSVLQHVPAMLPYGLRARISKSTKCTHAPRRERMPESVNSLRVRRDLKTECTDTKSKHSVSQHQCST